MKVDRERQDRYAEALARRYAQARKNDAEWQRRANEAAENGDMILAQNLWIQGGYEYPWR
jgi:hypothetical protein